MSAIVNIDGVMRPVRRPVPRIEPLTVDDLKDPKRVVRAYNALLELVVRLAQDEALPYVDFEDVEMTAAGSYTFRHGLGGRVRVFPVEVKDAPDPPGLTILDDGTDDNTVVVQALSDGTLTVRIQRSE